MSFKSIIIKQFAKWVAGSVNKMASRAVEDQSEILKAITKKAKNTRFGIEHNFGEVTSFKDYERNVPLRNYEMMRPYIDSIIGGDKDVLWPGVPKYFGKTSGTTSGVKYIPISGDSIKYHISTARNAILNYVHHKQSNVFEGKMIFLSGSPVLNMKGQIQTGRLSGIVNHEIPSWARPNQLPAYKTNCIEDWEEKLTAIVQETLSKDMRLISGIPPWVQMYYEQLLKESGANTVKDLFPKFSLFIHGGVNYEPYKKRLSELVGPGVDTLETYPASEGFIAFQNELDDKSLLLNSNAGMFYEFVPSGKIFDENPERLWLQEVEIDQDYAVIITSNAGLWSYILGDTVKFLSINPYKLIVTGRISHFISAFGEHVIAKEVEEAMQNACEKFGLTVNEFTVAPMVSPTDGGLPYHEWLIEFEDIPENLEVVSEYLDKQVEGQNIYYADLIEGRILRRLVISPLQRNAFRNYMKSEGRLGGQNKVPRLKDNRELADKLSGYIV